MASSDTILLVGLGNPGREYAHTRHNIGFRVADAFAKMQGADSKWKREHQAEVIKATKLIIAKPQTFMNRSGQAVAELMHFYKIPVMRILFVYDDMDMELGKLRFRETGSSGGHNGAQSIFDHLNTSAVARLKIGIGRPPAGMNPADYVLHPFLLIERESVLLAVDKAVGEIEKWMASSPSPSK